ncbi:MAG: hypothetical protein OEV35_03365 [Gallionellaceae bacterium]|nr:hypothetical protein [Gallionellaceae bacterium]
MTGQIYHALLPFELDHPSFDGHFPGRPIVPGVQLLDRAQHIVEMQCGLSVCGIQAAKFLSPAAPGDALELKYEVAANHVCFDIHCGTHKVASGQFLLALAAGSGS